MGYTHYWYRKKNFKVAAFAALVADLQKMVPLLEHVGVRLANWDGKGQADITKYRITFNGIEKCGHTQRDLGITWPSDSAGGVDTVMDVQRTLTGKPEAVTGSWFAGAELQTRTCGGDCSHEPFILENKFETKMTRYDGNTYERAPIKKIAYYRVLPGGRKEPVYSDPKNVGRYFAFCKTAYKPYDLAVNIALIIAKHHLGDDIHIHSDGSLKDWRDGMMMCQHFLGYGQDFKLDDDDEEEESCRESNDH